MATLEFRNVGKSFGHVDVLRNINLSVGDGDFLVLVGPSGCGKSTLLGIIAGLGDLTTGAVLIDGQPINHLEPKERDIAMVFQSYALYPSMTVAENIAFSLRIQGVSREKRMVKLREVADLLQIGHLLDRKPQALSGGQALPLPPGAGPVAEGRRVLVGLRPEWFSPVARGTVDGAAVEAVVEVIEPTGPDIYVALRLGATEIMARLPAGADVAPAEKRLFHIDQARAVLFDAETGIAMSDGRPV